MTYERLFICSVAVLALTACEQSSPSPGRLQTQQPVVNSQAATGSTRLLEIIWPPDESTNLSARNALPKAEADKIQTSPVPVLVPMQTELLTAPTLVTKEYWYSFSSRTPIMTVSLMGSRMAHHYQAIGKIRLPHIVRGTEALITQNEGIWSATWMEHGASYTLELECSSPTDAPCSSDELLRQLVSELVYVGGAGGAK